MTNKMGTENQVQSEHSIAVILPYFGNFPNYFPLWLQSCAANPSVHWFVFTDSKVTYDYPSNFTVIQCTLQDVERWAQDWLGDDIPLIRPHKLCDFKVLYGGIFSKWIEGYTHWGYCDVDLIFGDIRSFVTDEILNQYDKVFSLGHFAVMRNQPQVHEMIKAFALGPGVKEYVLLNPHTTLFDEWYGKWNVNQLFTDNGLSIYDPHCMTDAYVGSQSFKRTFWKHELGWYKPEKASNLMIWNEERGLTRYFVEGGKVQEESTLYIHLKERPMQIHAGLVEAAKVVGKRNQWAIFPSGFQVWEEGKAIEAGDFGKYQEGFFQFLDRRGSRKWKNGIYRLKLALGLIKRQGSYENIKQNS